MSLFVLLVAGGAFLVILALPLWRMSPRGGGAEWSLAWCALFASGIALRLSTGMPTFRLLYPALGTVFAGLLYAGARRYAGRPVRRGFWLLVVAVAAFRGGMVFVAPPVVTMLGAVLVVSLASSLGAGVIWRSRHLRRAGPAELLLVAALPALIATSSLYEWTKYTGADLQFGFFLWLSSGCFVAGTQVATSFEQYRAELEARLFERNEQLHASLVRLQEQQRLVAVGTLAAGIAHQINNPVGAIAAAAQFAILARDDDDVRAIQEGALVTVLEEAKRCGRIVKSVLQFARDEPTTKWPESLNPTVMRASELAREYVRERGGALTLKTTSEPLVVRMCPLDIEQVVVNLVRNGAESRADGANVAVQTLRRGSEAWIVVVDDGDGIDPRLRTRVLEPFFTTRREQGGSGLGLSVAHGVVTDHGGQLEIESRASGGTRFCVRLPLVDAA